MEIIDLLLNSLWIIILLVLVIWGVAKTIRIVPQ